MNLHPQMANSAAFSFLHRHPHAHPLITFPLSMPPHIHPSNSSPPQSFHHNPPPPIVPSEPLQSPHIPADPESSGTTTTSSSNEGSNGPDTPLDIGVPYPPQFHGFHHPSIPGSVILPHQPSLPKSALASSIRIELANKELWEKFDKVQNEMVVTRPGRKMFPKMELLLSGLESTSNYTLSMFMEKVGNFRYKYQAGSWSEAGQDDHGSPMSNLVYHHENWNTGQFWSSQERICFERVKLTNKEIQQSSNALISLSSMQKYQPVILLHQHMGEGRPPVVKQFRPRECQFIAVTAYQSEAVTKLKVEHNPFAKGFREGSSRKRTLSPLINGGISVDPFGSSAASSLASSLFSNSPHLAAKRQFLMLNQHNHQQQQYSLPPPVSSQPAASQFPYSFPPISAFPTNGFSNTLTSQFANSHPPTSSSSSNWFQNPLAAVAMASIAANQQFGTSAPPCVPSTSLDAFYIYSQFYQQMLMGQRQQELQQQLKAGENDGKEKEIEEKGEKQRKKKPTPHD